MVGKRTVIIGAGAVGAAVAGELSARGWTDITVVDQGDAAYGYTIDKGIACAWLPAELGEPGRAVEIAYFDRRLAATVTSEPLFDPQMQRLCS